MDSKGFENLGQYLKERRLAEKLTQTELANALDVHVQFVSNWERGQCAPPNHCFDKTLVILKADRKKVVAVMLEDSKRLIKERLSNDFQFGNKKKTKV